MKTIHMVAWVLLIVGGLNWGLYVFGYDIATWGLPAGLLDTVYVLVGLSALWLAFTHKHDCKTCSSGSNM